MCGYLALRYAEELFWYLPGQSTLGVAGVGKYQVYPRCKCVAQFRCAPQIRSESVALIITPRSRENKSLLTHASPRLFGLRRAPVKEHSLKNECCVQNSSSTKSRVAASKLGDRS